MNDNLTGCTGQENKINANRGTHLEAAASGVAMQGGEARAASSIRKVASVVMGGVGGACHTRERWCAGPVSSVSSG